MTSFLASEIAELNAVRAAVSEADFNLWFDNSEIKARFKKACMQGQSLRCCYCRRFTESTNNLLWDLEHILCEQHYPQFFATAENLAVACKQCNNAKGQEDVFRPQPRPHPRVEAIPTQSAQYSIPHPRFDNWADFLSHVNYQIYSSETPKGLELIRVCKLNKAAVEEAGLDYDQVVAALRTQFFTIVDNPIDTAIADADVVARMAGVIDFGDNLRAQVALLRLGDTLATSARRAAKRSPEQAVLSAVTQVRARAETAQNRPPALPSATGAVAGQALMPYLGPEGLN